MKAFVRIRGKVALLLCALLFIASSVTWAEPLFSIEDPEPPHRPRSLFWPQIVSYIVPGFDQWSQGQYSSATFYSGVALAGMGFSLVATSSDESYTSGGLGSRSERDRVHMLGLQTYQSMGGLSAYHSFRTAVRDHQTRGRYSFLKHEETTGDIFAAVFDFSYLKRNTTWIPLGLLAGVLAASKQTEPYGPTDFAYAGAFSFNAGTHEEAVFRGWLMPMAREGLGSNFWSNTLTALFFATAHGLDPVPWPQFVMGWYLGYLTQRNEWQLGESVFIHTWWDVLAINLQYLTSSEEEAEEAGLMLRTPPIYLRF